LTTRQMQSTSLEAFEAIKHKLGLAQQSVLDVFYENPDIKDWTNRELADKLKWQINCVTPRTNELVKLGYLEESRIRFYAVTGRNHIAWRIK